MTSFENLTIIVTGAARGFGFRLAERLHQAGANLVLSDLAVDPGDIFDAFAANRFVYRAGDVAEEETSSMLVETAMERFGSLDIAFNNAGIVHDALPLPLIPSDRARSVLEVDLLGVFFAMKHQIPAMRRQFKADGRQRAIVNTASVAGIAGAPTLSVYAAAKHGVVGLTRSAAAECARHGIRINAICPSFARTDMALAAIKSSDKDAAEAEAELVRGVPMRRMAEIDEVIEAMLFAASPANSFMTGQALAVDGGITSV
jgi:NAD(P)-dependent dehydrogenase (short-subunit alcohol dehydrogenase family)